MKTGILLLNLGTPDAPRTPEVRRYLREFLSDARVIDVPAPVRFALVNGIIAPFRAPRSAKAYAKVWTDEGSPLLVYGKALKAGIAERLPEHEVALGMRYGTPSTRSGLEELLAKGCDRILVAPLYPHYASSSTGTALECAYAAAGELWNAPQLVSLPPFYDAPEFVEALAAVARPVLDELQPDHVLFSYHGLPERHCQKSAPDSRCLRREDCCAELVEENRHCYRAQCFATSRALRSILDLPEERCTTSFQSRLGRDPWIKPYTDHEVESLGKSGVKRLAVFCPSFVADCLETLEEIGMEAEEEFREAGGERLALIPGLNDHPVWLDGLAQLLRAALAGEAAPAPATR